MLLAVRVVAVVVVSVVALMLCCYFYALDLWQTYGDVSQGIRLLGITVSDLSQLAFENIRLNLYDHQDKEAKTLAYKSNTLLSENEEINENKPFSQFHNSRNAHGWTLDLCYRYCCWVLLLSRTASKVQW